MKKFIFFTIGCGIAFAVSAQSVQSNNTKPIETSAPTENLLTKDYTAVDAYVLGLKKNYTDIYDLARDLTVNYTDDGDKVRAIYRWITENIAYDCKDYHRGNPTASKFRANSYDEEDFRYYFARNVIQSKKAVCEGYAVLFYELCKAANIRSSIVEGTADNNTKRIAFYRSTYYYYPDHAWNKVLLNGAVYYVDATWSSGTTDAKIRHFYKEFNNAYYLTPVNQLYDTHVENKY
ncbi:MAG: hypothetical protein JWP12_117 [Bacteroidetes bacterium]|nr:hypothetical protein [Bacteroidota bacterium]